MLGDRYDQNGDLVITIKSLIYYLRIKKKRGTVSLRFHAFLIEDLA